MTEKKEKKKSSENDKKKKKRKKALKTTGQLVLYWKVIIENEACQDSSKA